MANITTNHIRIYKLLFFLPSENLNFICNFLKLSKQTVILYIKQIYSCLDEHEPSTCINETIEKLLESKDLIYTLKQKQIFTREDRIFYIILKLLRNKSINLNALSKNLGITRRTLNDDLKDVKEHLKKYNINIFSLPSKGIEIVSSVKDLQICSICYLFKFFVEAEELPKMIIEDFKDNFDQNEFQILEKEIDYFVYNFEFDFFSTNKKLLQAFFIIYSDYNEDKKIKNLSKTEFEFHFNNIFENKNIEKIYSFFLNSSLGNLPQKYIQFFILTLRFCNGSFEEHSLCFKDKLNKIKSILEGFNLDIYTNDFLELLINRVHTASKNSLFKFMVDLSFLGFNLDFKTKSECFKIYMKLKENYFNIYFSNVIFIYLWSLNKSNHNIIKNTIVVFNDSPKFLQPVIKNILFLKENIKVSNFVRVFDIESYLENKDDYFFITFEKLNLPKEYSFIKYRSLPM